MYSKKAKIMIAEQIIGMIENNVLNENGGESFIGWLFFNVDCYTEEEIEEAMKLAYEIAPLVDELSWKIAPENDG